MKVNNSINLTGSDHLDHKIILVKNAGEIFNPSKRHIQKIFMNTNN